MSAVQPEPVDEQLWIVSAAAGDEPEPEPAESPVLTRRTLTQAELVDEAKSRFGDDPGAWAFQCPRCLDVASVDDFKRHGISTDLLGSECIGRHIARPATFERGCDWVSYGIFPGPWTVVLDDSQEVPSFPLAPAPGEGE